MPCDVSRPRFKALPLHIFALSQLSFIPRNGHSLPSSTFLFLALKIFAGKSINNPNYPPVKGTNFNQLLCFDKLYDCQTELIVSNSGVDYVFIDSVYGFLLYI